MPPAARCHTIRTKAREGRAATRSGFVGTVCAVLGIDPVQSSARDGKTMGLPSPCPALHGRSRKTAVHQVGQLADLNGQNAPKWVDVMEVKWRRNPTKKRKCPPAAENRRAGYTWICHRRCANTPRRGNQSEVSVAVSV